MEERYEIRGKIGQGGLGAVYRGYDTRMSREVAIKRISKNTADPGLQEESTRQLVKEAGALASLQHPHIVTIYDVGSDDDGPYVVMELINGKPLDELIERAPLTWPDFRELAMQTQEALIAAHELELIHSDIKPSNLMLTWLPSGKFQVKIVDFGLATLTRSQSRKELEEMEAVFGSIFFMAPEQFERVPLDARADLYSMGCVYYQALAGVYPFDGKTGQEVMQSHLQHAVRPLQELRADIPSWVCDWVMWQINRQPQDRPESARDSLSVFLQNDKKAGAAEPSRAANGQKRPRLIIPGAGPAPATSMPLTDPAAARPAPADAVLETGGGTDTPAQDDEPGKTITAPQPLLPPEGSKPSVHTAPQELPPADAVPAPAPAAPAPAAAAAPTVRVPAPVTPHPPAKRRMSNSSKTAIAAILGLLVVLLSWYLLELSGKSHENKLYNEMIVAASKSGVTELPVNSRKLELLLNAAANTGVVEHRQMVYKALSLAKATDGTDVDARIAAFATTREMLPDVREVLIRDVLRLRKNPAVVSTLLAYAAGGGADSRSAAAALKAVRSMAGDEQFGDLLDLMQSTASEDVRKAAEETIAGILSKSGNRGQFAGRLAEVYAGTGTDDVRHASLRLIGRCGGDKARELVAQALAGNEPKDQVAAIISLGTWADDSAFDLLTGFIGGSRDENLRDRGFKSAFGFIASSGDGAGGLPEKWTTLASLAKTTGEQLMIVRGLANYDDDWAVRLLEGFQNSGEPRVTELAQKALEHISDRKRLKQDK